MFWVEKKQGTTRTVFLVGQYAIKVPVVAKWRLFLMGLLANIQEQQFSILKLPELCPVLWAMPGGWFLVMRRARPLVQQDFDLLDYAEWIKAGKDLPKGEWIIPVENKPDSFGILDGRIVAVDYGS